VAGFDPARVPWRLTALGPRFELLEGRAAGHALLGKLSGARGSVALVGPWAPDLTQAEIIRRIRANPATRTVSVVALVGDGHGAGQVRGANAVLPLATDTSTLGRWVARLGSVPARARVATRVCGQDIVRQQPFEGVTQNISTAGMRVVSAIQVPVGADLDLNVVTGSPRTLPVLGRVVRAELERGTERRGYGIEFLYVPPATEDAIARLVERHGPSRSTADALHLGAWTYEILGPIPREGHWEAEVWRSRTGRSGSARFMCVAGLTPRDASREAREVLLAWALMQSGAAQLTTMPFRNAC
jgi:hypothetical protein